MLVISWINHFQVQLMYIIINFFSYSQDAKSLFNAAEFAPFDPTQEIIFPPELVNSLNRNMVSWLYKVPTYVILTKVRSLK